MFKKNFKQYGRCYFLENQEIENGKGKCIYKIEQNGQLKGFEVHIVRTKKVFGENQMVIASPSEFGRLGWYYMAQEKDAALKRYENINVKSLEV